MKSLWTSWPAVKRRIASKKKILLMLDFDGTLAPITKNPKAVFVRTNIRAQLKSLSRRRDCIVAIVSGRSLKDIRSRIHVSRVIYVGNHGLEIAGRGLRAHFDGRSNSIVRRLSEVFRNVFYFWPGVYVEDKVYTLSLHFRNIGADRKLVFDELVTYYQRKFKNDPIVWKKGKKVWEIRPISGWGKGDVALYLTKKFPLAIPIAIGDDSTDEDMFKVLKSRGITIRVGRSKRSSARYFVKSPKEVDLLLHRLC